MSILLPFYGDLWISSVYICIYIFLYILLFYILVLVGVVSVDLVLSPLSIPLVFCLFVLLFC